ncbi:Epoxyqueuosine reductase [subsurface metagenome]
MDERETKELIISIIEREVAIADTRTRYRQPLVGFAEVKREDFQRLREIVGEHHLLPDDLLPDAQSIVAFFLPFSEEVVRANRRSPYVAREWAVAYVETNKLLSHICEVLVQALKEKDIEAAWELPTYDFDKEKLVARWSHRSVAALAGLGSFGLNRLLITDSGCTGRYGSLLLKAKLPSSVSEAKERCLYFYDASCLKCVQRCPVNALTEKGEFDRAACYKYLLEVDAFFNDLPLSEVCGKCSVGMPCSLRSAVKS